MSPKITYEVGDEIWWFSSTARVYTNRCLKVDEVELVHDQIRKIEEDGTLVCWHCKRTPLEVWGKSRQEAWDRLKSNIERWGKLD